MGHVFGRKKEQAEPSPVAEAPSVPPGAGKNRPTPTRRDAQAARRQPLVPTDRKAAARSSKERERQERARQREAMLRGETWALPPRDRGPERAYIRDHVDARWSIGEFLMPLVLVGFTLSIIPNRNIFLIGYGVVYLGFIAGVVDFVILWFFLKRRMQAKFGAKPAKGSMLYALTRVMQIRVGRVPRPRVRRGQYPV